MAVISRLYNDVFKILETSGVINTVEDFNNQYTDQEEYNLVKYPACYVEIDDVEWDKSKNNFYGLAKTPQTGTADIKVHVVYHTLKSFTLEVKNEFFDVVNNVAGLLQRVQCGTGDTGTYTTLIRSDEEYLTPSKQLRACVLTFNTRVTDNFDQYPNLTSETVTMSIITNFTGSTY